MIKYFVIAAAAASSLYIFFNPSKKNEIFYESLSESVANDLNKFTCRGRFEKSDLLHDIGFDDSSLEVGAPCRKADFDKNGSLDYWFYKCDASLESCSSKVILMENDNLLGVVSDLPSLKSPDVFYFGDKGKHDYLESFGCQLPDVDALLEIGDGDGQTNRIHVLNQQKSSFNEFSRCTTVESM